MEFLQVLITGLGQGCLYGLIALGFVLIYKATEIVNFAQGDLLMLGAFFAVTYVGILDLPYWLAFLLTIVSMAAFGYLLDMLVIRSMIGESQFSVIILTISIGFILRSVAGGIWGSDILSLEAPYSGKMADVAGLVSVRSISSSLPEPSSFLWHCISFSNSPAWESPCKPLRKISWPPIIWESLSRESFL